MVHGARLSLLLFAQRFCWGESFGIVEIEHCGLLLPGTSEYYTAEIPLLLVLVRWLVLVLDTSTLLGVLRWRLNRQGLMVTKHLQLSINFIYNKKEKFKDKSSRWTKKRLWFPTYYDVFLCMQICCKQRTLAAQKSWCDPSLGYQ